MRSPDFRNLLQILAKQKSERPTLFELFLNRPLYERLTGAPYPKKHNSPEEILYLCDAYAAAGYDYATVNGSEINFQAPPKHQEKTISLNEGAGITDRRSFEEYPWPDPEKMDYSKLDAVKDKLPSGMKLIVMGPGGVLENVISLVGYEALSYLIFDDPKLTGDLFDAVGSCLLRYYELAAPHDAVGAIISNDDWGFNTQTFLSSELMRQYVFPWHKRIVDCAHKAGKPAILHSCGNLSQVMDDIIDDMKFDAKHSYEDVICPVEDMYEKYAGRIAILGGIDVDFLCTRLPEDIHSRSKAMLERTAGRGGYALGTGNSVPEYIPLEAYVAMTSAATGEKSL